MESRDVLSIVRQFIESTRSHIFLTGKAGTGKTTFLSSLRAITHKRFAVGAPTGIAALNAKGVTIHSQFLLPLGTFIPVRDPSGSVSDSHQVYTQNTLARRHPLNAARKEVLREIDMLVIDEVSMLRADILDAIDYRLRSARRNYQEPFGGVQLLMIGDLFQLPPIVRDHEWHLLKSYYGSMWFFDSIALKQSGFIHVELEKIFRQKDERFIELLNHLRNNTVTPEDIATLNGFYKPEKDRETLSETITLTTHNNRADQINQSALAALATKTHVYNATIEGDFPEAMYPVSERIELKEGAQIMFVKNDTSEGAYFNGKLATVIKLNGEGVTVKMAGSETEYKLKRETWENKKYVVDQKTQELEEDVIGTFSQFPIKLAWAITVHKSQGLTFEKAIIDVGRAFAPGQVYVALSRLRSLDGLTLGTKIDPGTVHTDAEVVAFSKRKELQAPLPELLQQGRQQYLQHVLNDTFNFSPLTTLIGYVTKDHEVPKQIKDESQRAVLAHIKTRFENEAENTLKFRNQLASLLQSGNHEKLMERLRKGADYYSDVLTESIKQLLGLLAAVKQIKRTKTFAMALTEIDQWLMNKLSNVISAVQLSNHILHNAPLQNSDESARTIANTRQRIVEEVEKEVAPLEAPPIKAKKPKGETYAITLSLIKDGKTIAQIAEERGLATSTIHGHCARLIGEGKVDISTFMSAEEVDEIKHAIEDDANESLGQVMLRLNEKYSFEQLRLVQAHLNKN